MRPWELLPAKSPTEHDPGEYHFYRNFVNPLNNDFIKIMANGIHVDDTEVENLRVELDLILDKVKATIASSKVIQDFQEYQYPIRYKEYLDEMETRKKELNDFIKPYKPDNAIHRTYVVNEYLISGTNRKDMVKDKWSVKDVKILASIVGEGFLNKVTAKSLDATNITVARAMSTLALDKMKIYNKSHYTDKVSSKTKEDFIPEFNPGSSKQLGELFEFLKIEPLAFTKEGNVSWGRDQVEIIFYATKDDILKELLQAFIDYSFGSIVRTNFIEAFDRFTIDGVLHGNLKNFGAKSYRPTSNSPNLLNMPSTKSIYAKPIKKCFVAPEGYIVASIDYSALEDRVIANLSKDVNKLGLFQKGLDGHSLAACYYVPDKVAELVGEFKTAEEGSVLLKKLVDEKNSDAKTLRQKHKGDTFKLAYGGFPDADKGGTITQDIFDAYHNDMYPGISAMKQVMMDDIKTKGYTHIGLGCRLYTDNLFDDSLTLFNAQSQFWSILTLIALNELHHRIDEENLGEDIKATATIYDALYFIVKDDVHTIKWLNDNIVPIMEKDFLENQLVHNEARLEVGMSWADQTELPKNATIEQIEDILDEIS